MIDLLKFKFGADDSETAAATRRMKQQLGGIRGALVSVNDYAKRTGRSMRNIGAGLSVGVTAPLTLLGKESISLYDQQVKAEAAVAQAIASTGGAAGRSLAQLKGYASELQGLTSFGDEDILRNVTAPLLTFTNVQGEVFDRTQANILDVATLLKTDLKSATLQVGKALNDPIKGLDGLNRAGIQFSDDQKAVIRSLAETGEVAAAQTLILQELEKQFQGQAAAAAATPLGQWRQLGNLIGDVKEELGKEIVPFLKPIAEQVKSAVQWFGELDPEVKRNVVVFGALAAAAGPVLGVLGLIALGVGGLITGFAALASPVGLVVLALGAAAGAAAYLVTQWDDLKARFPILQKAANLGQAIREKWSRLPAIKWALLIPVLRWARFIPVLRWAAFIPRISWLAVAGALSWRTLVAPLVWTARLIPGIGWVALAGALAWSLLIKKIEWGDGWIPRVEWADWIPRLSWPDWIPTVDWNRVFGGETAAEQARARAAEVGREFSAGLALGIAQGRGTGEAEIRSYLQDLENAAREESETQSPSRVFMRIGRDIMAGLGLGLREGREGVAAEMQGLAGELTSGLGTAGVDAAQQLRSSWKSTFSDFIKGAASATEAARRLLSALSDLLINQALNSLLGPIASGIAGAFGFSAKGNVFSAGRMTAFAAGGIVDRPTMFPMRGGTGLMGEAGPEAIMPLARGPDGRLGVRASGGGGATTVVLNFDPVIDARGADPGQIDRLERRLDRMAVEFKARVYQAMNDAARTGIDRRWAGA